MRAAFLVPLGLCLVGLATRTVYESLKKAGKVDPKSKVVFGIVFVGMGLMLTSWFFMGSADPWRVGLPGAVRWTGLGVSFAGLAMAVAGMVLLRGLENIDHLVTTGLFSRIRHPMYTGFILWILGWAVFYGAAASLLAGLVAIGNILYWRGLEEEKLVACYGDEYRRYRAGTWF